MIIKHFRLLQLFVSLLTLGLPTLVLLDVACDFVSLKGVDEALGTKFVVGLLGLVQSEKLDKLRGSNGLLSKKSEQEELSKSLEMKFGNPRLKHIHEMSLSLKDS